MKTIYDQALDILNTTYSPKEKAYLDALEKTGQITVTLNRHELYILRNLVANKQSETLGDWSAARTDSSNWDPSSLAYYLAILEREQLVFGNLREKLFAATGLPYDRP